MELICSQIDLARQKERVDFVKSYRNIRCFGCVNVRNIGV